MTDTNWKSRCITQAKFIGVLLKGGTFVKGVVKKYEDHGVLYLINLKLYLTDGKTFDLSNLKINSDEIVAISDLDD